jgi:GWxTD domain-containing protein
MMNQLLLTIILLGSFVLPAAGAQDKITLPEKYKKWLDEEVVYIMTSHERAVFRQLQTDKEREIFIEAFWQQRDPSFDTPRNEFKEEHYRRLEYANKFYRRGAQLPGWRTDRGRIHIILGPPKNIEQYSNVNGVYPVEIWFYLGDPELGFPTAFNVIFFKKWGTGDYVLYSPTEHGPRSLIADSLGNFRDLSQVSGLISDDEAAYQALRDLEPSLARQTLSLIPGERTTPGLESLASSKLMATIFASPHKKIEGDYADAILKLKDFVDVDYTANYVAGEALLQVIQDDSGVFLVHYAVEPAKISAEKAGNTYGLRFQLTGRVSDAQGRTVYQFDKDFPFSLTANEFEDVRSKSISIQDMFPLVPGSYNFDILLKNTLSMEFTSASKKVVVPAAFDSPQMSPLLLAYGVEKRPSPPGERIPFKAGDEQILCQTRKAYSAKDSLVLFFQLYGVTEELRSSGALRYVFYKDDQKFLENKNNLGAKGSGTSVFHVQPLKDFPPGYYQARVTLLDGQEREVVSQTANFQVSLASAVSRPLVVSKVASSLQREDDLYVTGIQCLNTGDLEAARSRLAEAYSQSPRRPEFAVAYSQALFRLSDFRRVKEVLLPLAVGQEPAGEVIGLLGQACHALGEYQEALTQYTKYLSRFGLNIDILNYLGTCYYELGNKEEALKTWTKSLDLSPNQERIRKLVESLKNQ